MGSAESNLASHLVRTATSSPDRPALKINGQDVTYGQLHGMAAKLAGALRANGMRSPNYAHAGPCAGPIPPSTRCRDGV